MGRKEDTPMLTNILLLPLMAYAAAGLGLSLTVHLLSYADLQLGGNRLFTALHVGIFPLWIPVVLIAIRMSGGGYSRDFWEVMLAESPAWMRYVVRGFFVYAVVNFILCAALLAFVYPKGGTHGSAPPGLMWRLASGHWMAFYGGGLVVLRAAWRRGLSNLQRRCANGHVVAWGDRFCPTCGTVLDATPAAASDAVNARPASFSRRDRRAD
jgi:hypothetical protein